MNTDWMEGAACHGRNPEWWFPFSHMATEARRAVNICAGCPVRLDCYGFAVKNNEAFGIWGGVSFGARNYMARGSYEEEEVMDAVHASLDSGWTVSQTAKHLRLPYNMVLRFAKAKEKKQAPTKQQGGDEIAPTGKLLQFMKTILKGQEE